MSGTQKGPCVVCGATDYPLSIGGPSICPRCDCGPPNPRIVREQVEALEAECALLAASLKQADARVETLETLEAALREIDAAHERSIGGLHDCGTSEYREMGVIGSILFHLRARALAGAAPTPRPDAPDYEAEAKAFRPGASVGLTEAHRIRAANEALEAAPTAEPPKPTDEEPTCACGHWIVNHEGGRCLIAGCACAPCTVWAVVYGNYEPTEVLSLHSTEAAARLEARRLGGMHEVTAMAVAGAGAAPQEPPK